MILLILCVMLCSNAALVIERMRSVADSAQWQHLDLALRLYNEKSFDSALSALKLVEYNFADFQIDPHHLFLQHCQFDIPRHLPPQSESESTTDRMKKELEIVAMLMQNHTGELRDIFELFQYAINMVYVCKVPACWQFVGALKEICIYSVWKREQGRRGRVQNRRVDLDKFVGSVQKSQWRVFTKCQEMAKRPYGIDLFTVQFLSVSEIECKSIIKSINEFKVKVLMAKNLQECISIACSVMDEKTRRVCLLMAMGCACEAEFTLQEPVLRDCIGLIPQEFQPQTVCKFPNYADLLVGQSSTLKYYSTNWQWLGVPQIVYILLQPQAADNVWYQLYSLDCVLLESACTPDRHQAFLLRSYACEQFVKNCDGNLPKPILNSLQMIIISWNKFQDAMELEKCYGISCLWQNEFNIDGFVDGLVSLMAFFREEGKKLCFQSLRSFAMLALGALATLGTNDDKVLYAYRLFRLLN